MVLPPSVQVPSEWKEDPRWRSHSGAGARKQASHEVEVPSRWVPIHRSIPHDDEHFPTPSDSDIKLVDYLCVPKRRLAPPA